VSDPTAKDWPNALNDAIHRTGPAPLLGTLDEIFAAIEALAVTLQASLTVNWCRP
jgi:hypothetical protein